MSTTVTFDDAPDPGTVNFGVGQPSMDMLPVALMRAATEQYLPHAVSAELNYGQLRGDPRFLAALADLLTNAYSAPVPAEQLMLSGGISQALDFVCAQLIRPGDTVLVEAPSYFLAFQIFADHGAKLVSVPVDEHGLMIDGLEDILKRTQPKALYTIPSFQNPTGCVHNAQRREQLVALSLKHNFLVLADEAYQLLHYGEPPPRALGTYVGEGNVLSMGSFSKVLAPALRLGWIQAAPDLLAKLTGSGVLNSGGNFNHFTSHIVRHAITAGLLDEHLAHLRDVYARRVAAMNAGLTEHMQGLARWRTPQGGYFFWLELLDTHLDGVQLKTRAADFKTGFQPGSVFSIDGQFRHFLRLSFAHYGEDDIREGIARLASLIRSAR